MGDTLSIPGKDFFMFTRMKMLEILKCKVDQIDKLEIFIPAKKETVIGGLDFLDEYILRGEKSDAIPKLYVRNIKTNHEEQIQQKLEWAGKAWLLQVKFMNMILSLKKKNW